MTTDGISAARFFCGFGNERRRYPKGSRTAGASAAPDPTAKAAPLHPDPAIGPVAACRQSAPVYAADLQEKFLKPC